MSVRISIAMATYNGERYIREQLDSFAAQTRKPDELVVTDDGSTDATLDILDRFAADAPFKVEVHRNRERLNYSRNFERAIALCTGDIIFLSDQDDVWFPQKIATVVPVFAARPDVQVVVNGQILTDPELNASGLTLLDNLKRTGRDSDGLIASCATAIRRSWGEKLFPMPREADVPIQLLAHDQWLHKLATLLKLRAVVDEPLQLYRRTGANTSSWVVSEARPINLMHLASQRTRNAPVDAWKRRLAGLNVINEYLQRNDLGGDTTSAIRALAHQRSSIELRIALIAQPLPHRLVSVWSLWRSGGYRYFERWLSAVNDVLRSK
jgi:glycosyltransferase involved in cell wall biosynthesis